MRRLVIPLTAVLLFLAFASPVAAARPITESGTYEFASAFASSCEQQAGSTVCTDTYLNVDVGPEWADACLSVSSYAISPGGRYRSISNAWGCAAAAAFSLAGDLSSASLGTTAIQLYTCGRLTCSEGDLVSVSGSWTQVGEGSTYTGRSKFTDGNCTYTQTFSGAQTEATAVITLDGTASDGWGYLGREEYTVTERCR